MTIEQVANLLAQVGIVLGAIAGLVTVIITALKFKVDAQIGINKQHSELKTSEVELTEKLTKVSSLLVSEVRQQLSSCKEDLEEFDKRLEVQKARFVELSRLTKRFMTRVEDLLDKYEGIEEREEILNLADEICKLLE